jgi:crotonobetainyl-CoA:carnitine CoA-transferase CaiB-like acyl-CoA transferase
MMLGDLGADIIKVEAPGRWDMLRSRPPFDDGIAAGHAFLNRNKRSLALDLKTPEGVAVVKRLAETYDIVIEQFRPGVMARLGLGYDDLRQINPSLIYCSLTGYGQTGPLKDRAGHDNNYLALAGVMSHTGTRDSGPIPLGVQVADLGAGSFGVVIGVLAAVVHRNATGEGQYVDVSMFDGAVAWNAYAAASYLVGGVSPTYQSLPLNGGSHYGYYRCKDGRFLSVGSLEPQFWRGFCETIGRPDLIDRQTLPGPEMDAVIAEIRAEIERRTLDEWVALFAKVDFCVEPVLTLEETFRHPQTLAREMIVDVPKAAGGTQRQVGTPLKFSAAGPRHQHTGGKLGEHTLEVLREAGYSPAEIAALRANGVFGDALDKL